MLLLLLLCRCLTAAWLVRNWDVQGMLAFINKVLNREGASLLHLYILICKIILDRE